MHAVRFHVVGERVIAEACALFGCRDRLVDHDGAVVRQELHEPEDFAERLARLMAGQDRVGDDNGAGIDEGVARLAALEFELDDRVEGTARRLAADAPPQPVADLAEREREREDLGDALDRERRVTVACRRDVALGVDHRNPERLRIGAGKLRNIGRDLAAVGPLPHLVGDFFDDAFKLRHGGGPRNHREPAVVGGL